MANPVSTDSHGADPAGGDAGLWSRLADARWILAAIAAVFAGLVFFGRLGTLDAVVGFALAAAAAVLIPRGAGLTRPSGLDAAEYEQLMGRVVRHFADTLAEPCFVLDRRGTVVHKNDSAGRYFPSTHSGDPIAFSMRYPALLHAIDTARRSVIPQSIELHQTVPNEMWFRASIAPLSMPSDHPARRGLDLIVVTLYNLTEQKRGEALRADFIANASHELRTPLTSLLGFIDTLVGPAAKDEAARERFLEIMRSHAERMSVLIDDLLSLSRIEMRQHVRPTERIDLKSVLAEVAEGLQTRAAEANVEINVDLPDREVTVTGDRGELYEVFENLVENAIKYGGEGGKVDMALASLGGRPGYDYAVTVTDYGEGIESEHVPRLTERFYRVDAESSRQKKGTGLGLAIVKHIVSRHHGTLSIQSAPGEGMRVEVLLPG